MLTKDLTILKLGGSLLTDKTKPYSLREDILKQVTHEIKECIEIGLLDSMIILHGVGSFGHPPVLEYKLHRGFSGPEQLSPLSKTQQIVNRFRLQLVEAFHEANVPIILMHPSSIIVSKKMKMTNFFLESLKGFMKLGMTPLLGGDLLYDTVMGFSVGSADQLASILADQLGANRLIFATDVDGVYNGDPKVDSNAELISEINLDNIEEVMQKMGQAGQVDASGAMKGKLVSLLHIKEKIKRGLKVSIISMLSEGNLISALQDKNPNCTKIVA